ncbi:hypothetical protein [Streptomyces buecherae]|uniref:Uncharacterized protein n=1 Tax=Streptomyces buecherae TaxID=2763006 RepID=A0A7H8NGI0_9ACTN|nr:hypothetical protein [Streptomyces buecherae]QKW53605.1 hypothetical protein HUT08_33225 [Streptomyces buecherae]
MLTTDGGLMEIRSVTSKHGNHVRMPAYAWLRAAGHFPPPTRRPRSADWRRAPDRSASATSSAAVT